MKIQIISDIHLDRNGIIADERYSSVLYPSGEILVLLGDIAPIMSDNYRYFIDFCSSRFRYVIIVLGNHEYKNLPYKTADQYQKTAFSVYRNVYVLSRSKIRIGNWTFIGATLWSEIPEEAREVVQAKLDKDWKILEFDVNGMNTYHRKEKLWLTEEIITFKRKKTPEEKLFVLTHFAPTFTNTSNPKHVGKPMNYAYCTDLEHLFPYVDYWFYGHTHYPQDQMIRGCRLISNPYGYHDENLPYDKNKILHVIEEKRRRHTSNDSLRT